MGDPCSGVYVCCRQFSNLGFVGPTDTLPFEASRTGKEDSSFIING